MAAAAIQHLNKVDKYPSWRVAAVVHPTEKTSVYVMRGTSSNPSADNLSISVTSVAGALSLLAIGPEETQTTEIGAKAEVLNGKLTLQTAAFNTVKTNLRVPNPANNTVTILDGAVTARGWEASAAGYLTDVWQVITSYALRPRPHHQDHDPDPAQCRTDRTRRPTRSRCGRLTTSPSSSRSAPAPSTTARSGAICNRPRPTRSRIRRWFRPGGDST